MKNTRVHLFIPCLVDQFFPSTGIAMTKILETAGINLIYPGDQTCCGQPAFNTGYQNHARELAQRFLRIFQHADAIVAPSGSCVSMVKVGYRKMSLDEESVRILDLISPRIFEFSEFLVDHLHITDLGASTTARITYHDSCHLNHELGITSQPRQLLRAVDGIDFIEVEASDSCCGFGGTFAVKHPVLSTEMARQKVDRIIASGCSRVIANDNSCLMQINGLLKRQNVGISGIHLADFLWDCMGDR